MYAYHHNSMLFCLPGKKRAINASIFTAQDLFNSDTRNIFIWYITSCEQQLTLRSKLDEVQTEKQKNVLYVFITSVMREDMYRSMA